MNEYYELLAHRQKTDNAIKKEKHRLHNEFLKTHRQQIKIMDIIVICIVLFNWGALLTTNALVERTAAIDGKVVEYKELNPVQAKANNWEAPPIDVAKAEIVMVLRQVFIWLILGAIYLHSRRYVFTEEYFFMMILIIAFYFIILGADFINNLGFYIGKILYR